MRTHLSEYDKKINYSRETINIDNKNVDNSISKNKNNFCTYRHILV